VYDVFKSTSLVDDLLKFAFPELYNKNGLSIPQDVMDKLKHIKPPANFNSVAGQNQKI
jgi:hypothetical protein